MESDRCLKFAKYIYSIVHKLETERKLSVDLPPKTKKILNAITSQLLENDRGILTLDQEVASMDKLLNNIYQYKTLENRRLYRELFLTTKSMNTYISGVLLNDEVLNQTTSRGVLFKHVLEENDILYGARMDFGSYTIGQGDTEESILLLGLDNLPERCARYKALGCDFVKVHFFITIDSKRPTKKAINRNAMMLAIFAIMCHEKNLVPIIVLTYDRNGDYDLQRCEEALKMVLRTLQNSFLHHRVYMEGIIFAPNILAAGYDCSKTYTTTEQAKRTLEVLVRTVLPRVAGITIVSDNETPEVTTKILNDMCKSPLIRPWKISFLFGRALQETAALVWCGWAPKVEIGQDEFMRVAEANSKALQGTYKEVPRPYVKFQRRSKISKHEFYI